MSEYIFSVLPAAVAFYDDQQQPLARLQGGYQTTVAGLFRAGRVDALATETLIYRIEEVLESQGRIVAAGSVAICRDPLLGSVCQDYLSGEARITPDAVEVAFNRLSEQLSYTPLTLTDSQADVFSYFVFIREMVHHLQIRELRWQP